MDTPEKQKETRSKRVESAQETGNTLAALAPELPFANESMDMLIDSWGPGLYLDRYEQGSDLEQYLQNISKVLTQEGEARIYPIDFYGDVLKDLETRNSKAKQEYAQILNAIPEVSYEFYKKEDSAENNSDVRYGIKIKKNKNQ